MKTVIFQNTIKLIRQIPNSLLNFLYPPFCLSCQRHFTPVETPYFCPQCWRQQPVLSTGRCPRCLEEVDLFLEEEAGETICGTCLKRNFAFDQMYSCLEFHGITRLAINQLKFRGLRPLALSISQLVLKYLPDDFNHQQYDYVLPVPLHKWRRWQRGFNQTYDIAKHLAAAWQLPIKTKIIKRVKPAPPQTKSTYKARQIEVKGRFALIQPDAVKDKSVLLFDDIATTRFTVNECARLLKIAGAKRVDVLTVALTVK